MKETPLKPGTLYADYYGNLCIILGYGNRDGRKTTEIYNVDNNTYDCFWSTFTVSDLTENTHRKILHIPK